LDPIPDPDSTLKEVSTLDPTPDLDPVPDPATLVSGSRELRGKLSLYSLKLRRHSYLSVT
jgi:hypothetical protein